LFCKLASQVGLFPLWWFKLVWINSSLSMDQLLWLGLVRFWVLWTTSWRIVCLDALNCNIRSNAIKCWHKTYWIKVKQARIKVLELIIVHVNYNDQNPQTKTFACPQVKKCALYQTKHNKAW
jgi:hypothetical protein